MKKQIHFFFYLLAIIAVQSCTKDRVPNPSSLNNNSQALIYDQNFDSILTLPAGWTVAGGSGGWAISDSSGNSSYPPTSIPSGFTGGGYIGASGKNNLEISNPTSGGTTSYTATSRAISTVGYTAISVIFGARNSSHFSDNGSTVTLAWSTDGKTWTNLPYQQNPNDSNWYLVNGGARINLPAGAANQPTLYFQWIGAVVATTSGTYRIDDVQVFGTK